MLLFRILWIFHLLVVYRSTCVVAHSNNTAFTGTSNKNRADLPDEFRSGCRLGDGEVVAHRCDNLLALAWRAKKKKTPVICSLHQHQLPLQ